MDARDIAQTHVHRDGIILSEVDHAAHMSAQRRFDGSLAGLLVDAAGGELQARHVSLEEPVRRITDATQAAVLR